MQNGILPSLWLLSGNQLCGASSALKVRELVPVREYLVENVLRIGDGGGKCCCVRRVGGFGKANSLHYLGIL